MSKILKLFMMLLLVSACSKKDNQEELTITDSEGNKVVYNIELAQTKEQLTTGLMNRTELAADAGMIFDLSSYTNVPTAMWMKDTPLSLDMIFIDKEGMIYWVYENAEPNSQKLIVAPYSAAAVLEVNAGDIKAKGIEIGDMVEYKLFSQEKNQEAVVSEEKVTDETAETEEAEVAEIADETAQNSAEEVVEEELVVEDTIVAEGENKSEVSVEVEEATSEKEAVVSDTVDEQTTDAAEVVEISKE